MEVDTSELDDILNDVLGPSECDSKKTSAQVTGNGNCARNLPLGHVNNMSSYSSSNNSNSNTPGSQRQQQYQPQAQPQPIIQTPQSLSSNQKPQSSNQKSSQNSSPFFDDNLQNLMDEVMNIDTSAVANPITPSSLSGYSPPQYQQQGSGLGPALIRCRKCDFEVLEFVDFEWEKDVEYLFFRNNYPKRELMTEKLTPSVGKASYACQCSWGTVQKSRNETYRHVGHCHWNKIN